MALKAIVAADVFEDEVPEPLRAHYKQSGETWVLGIEGVEAHPSVKGMRVTMDKLKEEKAKLKTERDAATEKLTAFGDLTPEGLEELRTAAETEGKKAPTKEELDTLIANKFGVERQRLTKQNETLEAKLKEKDTVLAKTTGQLHQVTIDTQIKDAAAKANVRAKALPLVNQMARDVWKLGEDGEPVAMKGDQVMSGAHGPLTVQEWLESLSAEHDYLFEPNKGGGAEGSGDGGSRGAGGKGKTVDLSQPNAIGKNLDAIAKGEVTGFTGVQR